MNTVLFQNGGQIGLCDIVGKGTIKEHAGGIASGRKLLSPCNDARRQHIHFSARNCRCKAGHQDTAAHRMHVLASDRAKFDGHAQIEAKFKQQLIENVGLCAPNPTA